MQSKDIKQFFVKTSQTRTLFFDKDKLIKSIFDDLKLDREIFYMVYAGKVLDFAKTLKYYDIQQNSTINVYLRAL